MEYLNLEMGILDKILVLSISIWLVSCDMNKNRAYINLAKPIPCIRRFNSTHQIGCAGITTGIVYAIRNQVEFTRLDQFQQSGSLGSKKLIVISTPQWFVKTLEWYKKNRLDNKETNIAGLVLIVNQTGFTGYSDDLKSPSAQFGLYGIERSNEWNPNGNGFLFEDYKIPIYVITDEKEANQPFDDCYDKFNKAIFERVQFSLGSTDLMCGMQLGMDMSGAVSSRVCTRRSNIVHTLDVNYFCDPLGGSTYLTPLNPQRSTLALPNLIISARMDTFTLFEAYTPGANEPISALIGVMVLAELLGKVRTDMDKLNPMFVLFDNEAFEYGGSSKFVADLLAGKMVIADLLTGGNFNLDKNNLLGILELNQLGFVSLNSNNKLYIHKDPVSYQANQTVAKLIDELTIKLQNYSNGNIIPTSLTNTQLPPSSSQQFLRQNLSIAALTITDHEKLYLNPNYHSVFDTPYNLGIVFPDNVTEPDVYNYTTNFASRLAPLLVSIAQTVYSQSNSQQKELKPSIDETITLLNKLVYCFYKNTTCEYFRSVLTGAQWTNYGKLLQSAMPNGKLSFYTSVNDNLVSGKYLSLQLLRYFTRFRELDGLNMTACVKDSAKITDFQTKYNISLKSVQFVKGGSFLNATVCVTSTVQLTSAVSPAFDKVQDGELVNVDKYSAWTESSWNGVTVQVKMFMFTQSAVKGVTLSLGIITTIAALLLTLIVNKYAGRWFLLKNPEQAAEFFE